MKEQERCMDVWSKVGVRNFHSSMPTFFTALHTDQKMFIYLHLIFYLGIDYLFTI